MNRILIIEDNEEILNNLGEKFENSGYKTILCSDRDTALKAIEDNIPFDVVILDWYFVLDGDSAISKEILKKLYKKHFIPVFIYTGHLPDFKDTLPVEYAFPENLITAYEKTLSVNELTQEVQKLLASHYSLQLANTYRHTIKEFLEKIFFELNELENIDIAMILNKIYGDGENIDWSNDFILNLLHRSLISDNAFIGKINKILKDVANVNEGTNAKDRKKILNKILYYNSITDYIRNGDIVSLKKEDGDFIYYGVVVTPDCDLEKNKTQFIEIVELKALDDAQLNLSHGQKDNIRNYNHDSFYLFPAINLNGTLKDFVAVFKSRFILQEKDIIAGTKYPQASKRHLYSQNFMFNGNEVKLNLICSKVNPYKAEFLHKLHSHNSRVGIPDIKNLL
jgi:CheY-like chemotaxis protein